MNKVRLRLGTLVGWFKVNVVLSAGQIGYEVDSGRAKKGDGRSTWKQLPYYVYEPSNHDFDADAAKTEFLERVKF